MIDQAVMEERTRIISIIEAKIENLNKKEHYAFTGKKKFCCQAELMVLKNTISEKGEQE